MKKDKETFREKFNRARKRIKLKDLPAIGRDTLQDLKQPKEIGIVIAAVVVPGGAVAYAIYRAGKFYRKQKPVNDNDGDIVPKEPKPPLPKPPCP